MAASDKTHRFGSSLRWTWIALAVFIAVYIAESFWLHRLQTTELRLTDVFMRHHAQNYHPDPDIIVVDIDNATMAEMESIAGLWAWPREIHADLLDGLSEFEPRAVVFDLAFTERDMRHPKSDQRLSDTIIQSHNIFLPATLLKDKGDTPTMALDQVANAFGIKNHPDNHASALLQLPLAVAPKGWHLGLINNLTDADGTLRRYRLVTDVDGWDLPSLPKQVAQTLGYQIPDQDNLYLRWPEKSHKRLRYSDLYKVLTEQRPDLSAQDVETLRQQIHNKIIFIGSSAASAFDHHLTPIADGYVGVDILAVTLDNLKNQQFMQFVSPFAIFSVWLFLLLIQAWAFKRRTQPSLIALVLVMVTVVCIGLADHLVGQNKILSIVTPLLFIWIWFLGASTVEYFRERRTRDQAVALFGRFLNPGVVKKIIEQGETVASLSGQTRQVTVLFSDIRGFTTLSESQSPQRIVDLLNRYFDRQVEIIFKHHGTLDKFIGDCIMAFWGAPFDDPNQAKNALNAALEMQDALLAFNQELQAEQPGQTGFEIGIGIHTGQAVVGFIGAQKKLDYTAIGDTVNLASRVEGLTKDVSRILVTKEVMEACSTSDEFTFELRGTFAVKGRSAQVELYAPTRKRS